jgi:hypothetical protein
MTAVELSKVKEYQRDFYKTFKRKLEIDWQLMNDIDKNSKIEVIEIPKESLEDIFEHCINKHNADLDVIRNRSCRVHKVNRCRERKALVEFCTIVVKERYSVSKASKLINRDRSCVYNFSQIKP